MDSERDLRVGRGAVGAGAAADLGVRVRRFAATPTDGSGTFQGDGLLIVDPGNGEDVVTIAARAADQPIPVIRCVTVDADRVIVHSAGPCSVTKSSSARGIDGAKTDFAEAFARASGVAGVRPAPSIWSSWYQYFNKVTEADMDENLAAILEREVPVDVVQLDDGYQAEIGDWLELSNRFRSLAGMVERIRAGGLRAGIWIAPFLVGSQSRLAAEHPDWLVRDSDDLPVQALRNWGQDTHPLDVTHPDVRAHWPRSSAGSPRSGSTCSRSTSCTPRRWPGDATTHT